MAFVLTVGNEDRQHTKNKVSAQILYVLVVVVHLLVQGQHAQLRLGLARSAAGLAKRLARPSTRGSEPSSHGSQHTSLTCHTLAELLPPLQQPCN